MSQEEATKALQDKGLQVSSDPERSLSDSVESGKVISSNPAAGTEVDKNSTVRLKISSGRSRSTPTPTDAVLQPGPGQENRNGGNNN